MGLDEVELKAKRKSGGGNTFVARIHGKDSGNRFNRDFLTNGARGSGKAEVRVTVEATGLYECRDIAYSGPSSRFHLVYRDEDGGLAECEVDDGLADEIAEAFDRGQPIEDLVIEPRRGVLPGPLEWRSRPRPGPRDQAIARIRRLMAEHGITPEDLG